MSRTRKRRKLPPPGSIKIRRRQKPGRFRNGVGEGARDVFWNGLHLIRASDGAIFHAPDGQTGRCLQPDCAVRLAVPPPYTRPPHRDPE